MNCVNLLCHLIFRGRNYTADLIEGSSQHQSLSPCIVGGVDVVLVSRSPKHHKPTSHIPHTSHATAKQSGGQSTRHAIHFTLAHMCSRHHHHLLWLSGLAAAALVRDRLPLSKSSVVVRLVLHTGVVGISSENRRCEFIIRTFAHRYWAVADIGPMHYHNFQGQAAISIVMGVRIVLTYDIKYSWVIREQCLREVFQPARMGSFRKSDLCQWYEKWVQVTCQHTLSFDIQGGFHFAESAKNWTYQSGRSSFLKSDRSPLIPARATTAFVFAHISA